LPGAPAGFTAIEESAGPYPPLHYSSGAADNIPADISVVTYGGMTDMTEAAMNRLILDEETEFDYFILTRLSPLDIGPIAASVRQTGRLLVVEEGPSSYGVGAELIAALVADPDVPAFSAQRVGAAPVAIPSARTLEDRVLPDQGSITAALLDLLDG
ncbi:MAG: transketolase C-terminal domain-containing protein, partial [Gammaproteobacteria bacterium]